MNSTFRVVIIAAALATDACGQSLLTNGLVAYYPLNGNALDTSGNANHGTIFGGVRPGTNRFGIPGTSSRFNGTTGYIQIPNSSALDRTGNSPISVSLWAYRVGSSAVMHLFGKRADCGTVQYQMAFDSDGLHFGPGYSRVVTGVQMPLLDWIHLAATFDGTTFRFYTNGVAAATSNGTLGPAAPAGLEIGRSGTCGWLFDERI
jgi:hypothetical protein